ncbi:MAG: hypothetical protein PHF35_03625 [Candidatus Moranbacteria bacterium]|nr:hypothetical protein [Candidatus Moranbacteria bacterium]
MFTAKNATKKGGLMNFQLSEELRMAIQSSLRQNDYKEGIMEVNGFPGCRYYVADGEQPNANLFRLDSNLFPGLPKGKKIYLVL